MQLSHPSNPDRRSPDASRRIFLRVMIAGAAGFAVVSCSPSILGSEESTEGGTTKTLRVAWGGAPKTLDPLTASADAEIAFLNAVYDYLVDTNTQSELTPRLAIEWDVSNDGLTYTLQIAEGVKFHDGSDLAIDDIIWTFNRLRDPAHESPTSDLYADIESIEAGDGRSVVFRLSEPNPDFLYNLSDSHAVILKANAANIGNNFNGTGPFKLQEYTVEDRATFVSNTDYWNGAPAIDTLEFVYFPDIQAAVNALRDGSVNVILRMDNATFQGLSSEEVFNSIQVATNGHDLVRLRADREPGNDERVRRAFKMATDREAVFARVQLGFGAVGRDTPIGPLYSAYYTEEFSPPEYNPAEAKDLLAEAGYPTGLAMTLFVPDLPDRVALAQALAAQWEEAGIHVTIEPQDEATYYADDGWLEVDLGITPWASRPTPQFYLDVAYKTDAVWNEAHFSDRELDDLIDVAGSTLDDQERLFAYHEIQRILIERGPVIIPYFFAQFGVMADNIEGVDIHPYAGRTNFHRATIM